MHLRNQPPVFVPSQFVDEIERLSKAALMDLAWDFATTVNAPTDENQEGQIMATFRARRDVVLEYRSRANGAVGKSL